MYKLRRRLTEAIGVDHQTNVLRRAATDNFIRYEEKFLPLLQSGYQLPVEPTNSTNNINNTNFLNPLALKHALNVPIIAVTNLSVQPGEPWFVFWFFVSSYFPLLSGCLGPLANLISMVGLIEHWRKEVATGELVEDRPPMVALNAVSFAFGIVGNISLLMNFSGTVRYMVSQLVCISCWMVATVTLLADVVVTNRDFTGPNPAYVRTEGFWFGIFTTAMYGGCVLVLAINLLGCHLKKYPPIFNLDTKQRTLMVYTICFAVWLVVGAIVIKHMIEGLSYGASLYFCTVSMLTIGLGDILPGSHGAKVFVLVFSLIGVLIMGLIVAMIRQVVLSLGGPTIFWHQIEKERIQRLHQLKEAGLLLTSEEAFHEMRLIRRRAKVEQTNFSLLVAAFVFILFWLVGAVVFWACEEWLYFNAVYFCFLCLLTIGYGDFAPRTPLGRVFFILWAIAAVPLMTILISNFGDKLYDVADRFGVLLTRVFNVLAYRQLLADRLRRRLSHEDLTEEVVQIDEEEEEAEIENAVSANSILESAASESGHHELSSFETTTTPVPDKYGSFRNRISAGIASKKKSHASMLATLDQLKPLLNDSLEQPSKHYDHEEWLGILDSLGEFENPPRRHSTVANDLREYFWLSGDSPLRLPLKEPNYLIIRVFLKIERDLKSLIEDEERQLDHLETLARKKSFDVSEM